MEYISVTFAVNYHDPDKMNQPDVTRHFATEHQARVFVENLDKLAPLAQGVKLTRITTKREVILDSH